MDEPAETLTQRAIQVLRDLVPPQWTVELSTSDQQGSTLTIGPQGAQGNALLEARSSFKPGDLDTLLGSLARRLRVVGGSMPIIVLSDALSSRARDVLVSEDIGYVDLSGNVRISLGYPPVFINLSGDRSRPSAPQDTSLRGAKAARLVRFLCDVEEPYGLIEIASATKLSRGYVSRLLDRLVEEALIERASRGPVTRVDWPALLRRRAEDVSLLRTNKATTFVSRTGPERLLDKLAKSPMATALVVTGSFAAYRWAPVASPTLLALYSLRRQSSAIEQELGLLSAPEGGDVVVLDPPNDIALAPVTVIDGVRYAAPTQVAIDCLSGPGRMPAEGEALLEWMAANVAVWRSPSIEAYLQRIEEGT